MTISAQTIIVGDKSYSSTPTWNFQSNDQTNYGTVNICVAKNGDAGLFYISTSTPYSGITIVGPVTIYLMDNTVIKCITVFSKDYVNSVSTVIFKLTKDEVDKMSKSRISTVRYNTKNGSSPAEAFTADNKRKYFYVIGQKKPEGLDYYETDVDIKTLFGL